MVKYRNRAMLKKIFSVFSFSLILAVLLMPIQALCMPVLAEPYEPQFWAAMIGVAEYQYPLCMFDKEWNVYPVDVKYKLTVESPYGVPSGNGWYRGRYNTQEKTS